MKSITHRSRPGSAGILACLELREKDKAFSEKRQAGTPALPGLLLCLALVVLTASAMAQQKKRDAQPSQPETTAEESAQLEAVIATDAGVIRFEFFSSKALKHTQQFIKLARAGSYDGSAFHRVIPRGIIQGGDPLLKDPQAARERWGTGGLNKIADEFSDMKHVRGIVDRKSVV